MKKKRKKIHYRPYFIFQKIDVVVRFLTISDFLILSGFGLIAPIFAVFVTDSIQGGNVEVVGLASSIYLIVKSVGQIPIARFIDKTSGEKDDFWAMLIGSLFFSLVPLFYIFVDTPMELYLVQFFYGLAAAFTFPAWMAIFTRHIDKEREGVEWGVYQTLIDLGSAATASLGGFLAFRYGFAPLFVVVSVISFLGSLYLLSVYQEMRPGKILTENKKNVKKK